MNSIVTTLFSGAAFQRELGHLTSQVFSDPSRLRARLTKALDAVHPSWPYGRACAWKDVAPEPWDGGWVLLMCFQTNAHKLSFQEGHTGQLPLKKEA